MQVVHIYNAKITPGRALGWRSTQPAFHGIIERGNRNHWIRKTAMIKHRFTFDGPTGAPHMRVVKAVAISPDGRLAVSAGYDGLLKVWDLNDRRLLRTLADHSDSVNAVAIHPGGQWAISASGDQTLKVWDLASNGASGALRTLQGHTDWVGAVAISPDGRLAVSGANDETLKVWDLERGGTATGGMLCTLEGHTDFVRAVAISPDGSRVVSAAEDTTLKVWDLACATANGRPKSSGAAYGRPKSSGAAYGCELFTLRGHTDWIAALVISPDGRLAIS